MSRKKASCFLLPRDRLQDLLDLLHAQGYEIVGPTVRDGAIIYAPIRSEADLPIGWRDVQAPGHYRLERRDDAAVFGYVVGPYSWKRFLHPPVITLWKARRTPNGGFEITATFEDEQPPRYVFFGMRPCELHAVQVQDRVFLGEPYADPVYRNRRANIFTVVVNCVEPGPTCFCASLKTGPAADAGYDLLLTELLDSRGHRFLLRAGSAPGEQVVQALDLPPAPTEDLALEARLLEQATQRMGRYLDTSDLKERLYARLEPDDWEEVAQRCLACGNCTLVCPTCFCTTVEDVTDLSGNEAARRRVWDSCFNLAFSYIHGGSVRQSTAARYRQWITHKLATWQDQFGVIGCVGCGRCITWCPVGIDITVEARKAAEPGSVSAGQGG